jgi:hypothetical protein
LIEKTSSTGIRNGLSILALGSGMCSSSASSSSIDGLHQASSLLVEPSIAARAEPRMTGTLSSVEVVLAEQFANFHLDEVEQLFVIDEVDLVQEHNELGTLT